MTGTGPIGEILATLRRNKLRTFLTGFSIAWGIFMLIVLLGMGNGLRNGMEIQFDKVADNHVSVWSGYTSLPYDGLPAGRNVMFDDRTQEFITYNFPEIDRFNASISKYMTMTRDGEYLDVVLQGANPDLQHLKKIKIKDTLGRFINDIDERERRKVIIIDPNTRKVLFKDENPIGKWVVANNISLQIVGIYDDAGESYYTPYAYIPFETARALFNADGKYYHFELSTKGLETIAQQRDFSERLHNSLALLHRFDPEDRSAVYIENSAESRQQGRTIMGILNIFLGIIGFASMIAGIVGVGNIMYVTVKERTREIGIRKAIGASPASVIRLVILEAIFITTVSGYAGIVIGSVALRIVGKMIASSDSPVSQGIVNPSINLGIIFTATLILIISGVVAGFIPAWKAAQIKPVEAMKRD